MKSKTCNYKKKHKNEDIQEFKARRKVCNNKRRQREKENKYGN